MRDCRQLNRAYFCAPSAVKTGLICALMFWHVPVTQAQTDEAPPPGVSIIGGERFKVTKTAADRADIKPEILPEMYVKCVDYAKQAYEMLSTSETLSGEALTRFQLRASASNANCERLSEIMLEAAAEEKLLANSELIEDELAVAIYARDAAARERTLARMEMAGWPTGVIRMNLEDLGIKELPELE
ncbi:MAG: hypothetical protein RIB03_12590 [Henriciella sp.]|uniref:hypothetical protein n=1 Tax=Henriciella sp. TaxID=1968823 RepID=UPI0032EECD06